MILCPDASDEMETTMSESQEQITVIEKLVGEAAAKIAETAREIGRAGETAFAELGRVIRRDFGHRGGDE